VHILNRSNLLIIGSYLWFYLASLFFEWPIQNIFYVLLLETNVIFILYFFIRISAEQQFKKSFRKVADLYSIAFGHLGYIFIQGLFLKLIIHLMLPKLDGEDIIVFLFSKEFILSLFLLPIIYGLNLKRLPNLLIRELVLRQKLMIHYLLISGTMIVAFLLLIYFIDEANQSPIKIQIVLAGMVLMRMLIEVFFKDSSEDFKQ
jgi:hypothetical protein